MFANVLVVFLLVGEEVLPSAPSCETRHLLRQAGVRRVPAEEPLVSCTENTAVLFDVYTDSGRGPKAAAWGWSVQLG